jgi:hypothetical protein
LGISGFSQHSAHLLFYTDSFFFGYPIMVDKYLFEYSYKAYLALFDYRGMRWRRRQDKYQEGKEN